MAQRDASTIQTAHDWANRYESGNTPWDLGGPHPELALRLQDGRLAPPREGARVLVPGAGRGHDALALARRGWDVTAIDVVEALSGTLGPALERYGGRFLVVDALTYEDEPFELLFDHTFFCAISPDVREEWGRRAAALVAPSGHYAALMFPVGRPAAEGGPPYGMDATAVTTALGAEFRRLDESGLERPAPGRPWRE
ncbi:MAG: hypothetical protein AAGA20_18190, partial [Planctomycetota bacterium]